MKLDPLFKSEKNKLYTLDGSEVSLVGCPVVKGEECSAASAEKMIADCVCAGRKVFFVEVPWSLVGKDESSYNEEFLASFRDWLKVLEDKGMFAVVEPVAAGALLPVDAAAFTASMKHCARRIKDASSVIGFVISAELGDSAESTQFVAELSEKHAQYIFFSSSKKVLENEKIVAK